MGCCTICRHTLRISVQISNNHKVTKNKFFNEFLCGYVSLWFSNKSNPDAREQLHRIGVIDFLQHLIGERESAQRRLVLFRQIGIDDRRRADICGFPKLSMRPESRCEEVEGPVV